MSEIQLPFATWTARELMRSPVEVIPQGMSLRAAAQFLYRKQIGGAPVVDGEGKCVGVLSAADIARSFHEGVAREEGAPSGELRACSYQERFTESGGKEATRCILPAGACPAQVEYAVPGGEPVQLCLLPHCVFVDWQMLSELPDDDVSRHMTTDVVTASRETPITELARMMVDAHIHRVVVVDDDFRPIGIITATDLLAAIAREGLPRAGW
jgi:CBS domain-containing protein